jgi:small-conductance mechanosensitive channel
MVLRIFLILFFVVLSGVNLSVAAEGGNAESGAESAAAEVFPGLSELGTRSSNVADFVAKAEERLQQVADLARAEESLNGLKAELEKIKAEMLPLGSPDSWYVDRLNNFLSQLRQVRLQLDALQQRLAARQQEIDKIREQALKDQKFWSDWEKDLKKRDVKLPKQTLTEVNLQLNNLLRAVSVTTDKLLQFQDKVGIFQRELTVESDQLGSALGELRKVTFRRNAYSLFSADFYRQFDGKIGAQVADGVHATVKFDRRYLQENIWLSGLWVCLFVTCAGLLRYGRKRFPETEEWTFVFKRPLATASFIAIVFCWLWFPAPPALVRFIIGAVAVMTAISLALILLDSQRQKQILILAAGVFLLTNLLQLISFPQPLFRLYLLSLAIVFVPLLYRQVDSSRKLCQSSQGRIFRALLRFAIFVLVVSFFAQLVGYANFSAWLIKATFETGMVFLFLRMAVLLLSGIIDIAMNLLLQAEVKFFQSFGDEFGRRLKRLLKFILTLLAIFYLLPVWRLFATYNESWTFLSDLGLQIGSFNLSLKMVGSALFAFYLALQISWILQTVTESQVLEKRKADRGVQDAVKKLIHYAIVLVGFLFAMSLLGLELQNFMVLLGAFGVGIGFGLQDIVNNFLSGLILLFERPIKVGDGVLIDGEYGTVISIGMRSTIVKNLDEAELIVPNSQMISQKVTNWTLSTRRVRVVVPVGVAYGSDLEKVLAVLTEAAEEHPEVLKLPKPTPLFIQFGASCLDFELRVWISNVDNRPRIKNELLLYIDRRFREERIEIPFSQHDLHLRSIDTAFSRVLGTDGKK